MTLAAFDPGPEAGFLLGVLAWCATAAGVFGILTVGILMSLQLRHGVPGEKAEHLRGLTIIMIACVIAASAGPLVQALGSLTL